MPAISIIVPVYNCENYIEECISSILGQSFKDYEIIIINDGSTDSTLKKIQKYNQFIKLISISNHGQSFARNLGLKLAKGDYICFVDSDDYLDQEYLNKLYLEVQKYNADIAFCLINRFFDYKRSHLEKNFCFDNDIILDNPILITEHKELLTKITIAPFAKLIKREFLYQNKIEFLCGKIYEDLLFTITLLLNSPNLCLVDEKLYNYRMRKNSTITSKKSNVFDIFFIFDSLYKYMSSRNLVLTYKLELDYLMLYHVGIGTVYRLASQNPLNLISHMKKCSSYLKQQQVSLNNPYFAQQSIFIKVYLRLLMKF